MIKAVEKLIGSSFMLGLIHAEEENPERKINAADDTEIPPVAFEEAMSFLKRKTSITKDAFYKLEPKLRFRAFTVAKLGSAKAIEVAKQQLGALEDGTGYRESWERIKAVLEEDSLKLTPGYWETVFRTNTQSAYIAGKLEQYQDTNVAAYQLMVIEDSRTSKICRHLLTASGYGMILPVDHPFWKKYGFGPYHMNCRTSISAIYPSQIGKYGNNVDNPSMKSLAKFKPQSGFGGNPLDTGNWWKLTPSQLEQAIKYGILGEFNREENIFADYDNIWKGYTRHEGKNGGWYDLCDIAPDDWQDNKKHPNKPIVEFLAEHGYHIKVIPELKNIQDKYNVEWSNPDILLDGYLTDIKTVETSISSRLKKAKKQHVNHVVLKIPNNFTEYDIQKSFEEFREDYHKAMWILYIHQGTIHEVNI